MSLVGTKVENRPPGMSQLDLIWGNYNQYNIATSLQEDGSRALITQKVIQDLLDNFSGISDIQIVEGEEGAKLVITVGDKVFEQPLPTGATITDFTKRQITQADRNKGCELALGTPVYSITMSNGNEYLAPALAVGNTGTIALKIIENAIYADLKLSNKGSVKLSEDEEGLKGDIVLDNTDKFIKFSLLTESEYSSLDTIDETTVYFIKGKGYFYFGTNRMAGESGGLDDYYTKQQIDDELSNYVKKEDLSWNDIF